MGLIVPLLSALGACVSSSRYEARVAELEGCQDKRGALEQELADKVTATEEDLAKLREQRELQEKQLALFEEFTAKFQKMIDVGDVDVYIRRGRMVVGLPSRVLFASGSSDLSERGQRALADVASALKELPRRRILVAGHTDNKPIGGKLKEQFADNWELSSARALTVTRFLLESGVRPRSLAAAGYASFDPVRSNAKPTGRRLNRRIELVLEPRLAELPKLPPALRDETKGGDEDDD